MRFTNCTTRKPLFHEQYESNESYGSWTCIYTITPSNDLRFTNCTTREPLFHHPYESNESYGSWTCIYTITPSNDLRFTNCTTRKPLFHHPYESNEWYGKEDAIIRIVSVRVYWTTLGVTPVLLANNKLKPFSKGVRVGHFKV